MVNVLLLFGIEVRERFNIRNGSYNRQTLHRYH